MKSFTSQAAKAQRHIFVPTEYVECAASLANRTEQEQFSKALCKHIKALHVQMKKQSLSDSASGYIIKCTLGCASKGQIIYQWQQHDPRTVDFISDTLTKSLASKLQKEPQLKSQLLLLQPFYRELKEKEYKLYFSPAINTSSPFMTFLTVCPKLDKEDYLIVGIDPRHKIGYFSDEWTTFEDVIQPFVEFIQTNITEMTRHHTDTQYGTFIRYDVCTVTADDRTKVARLMELTYGTNLNVFHDSAPGIPTINIYSRLISNLAFAS